MHSAGPPRRWTRWPARSTASRTQPRTTHRAAPPHPATARRGIDAVTRAGCWARRPAGQCALGSVETGGAGEVGGQVGVAVALVPGHQRVPADRPGLLDAAVDTQPA